VSSVGEILWLSGHDDGIGDAGAGGGRAGYDDDALFASSALSPAAEASEALTLATGSPHLSHVEAAASSAMKARRRSAAARRPSARCSSRQPGRRTPPLRALLQPLAGSSHHSPPAPPSRQLLHSCTGRREGGRLGHHRGDAQRRDGARRRQVPAGAPRPRPGGSAHRLRWPALAPARPAPGTPVPSDARPPPLPAGVPAHRRRLQVGRRGAGGGGKDGLRPWSGAPVLLRRCARARRRAPPPPLAAMCALDCRLSAAPLPH